MPTHYEVLGVPPTATGEEVRHAYRRLVKASHPDAAGDPDRFRTITVAYDVLSDATRRAAYDRRLGRVPGPTRGAVQPADSPRPRRYGRYAVLLVAALVVSGIGWLAVEGASQSIGDRCLVGRWSGDAFEVPFRGSLDGRDVALPIRGGEGVVLRVSADGTVRTDYTRAAPLVGTAGSDRVEGAYTGATIEHWHAADGRVTQSGTDSSGLRFRALIDGRDTDQPLSPTVLDGDYPYTCTPTRLELGPYGYTRA